MEKVRIKLSFRVLIGIVGLMGMLAALAGCSSSTEVEETAKTGWEHFSEGDYDAGLGIFMAEARRDTTAVAPLVGMGWCYLSLNDLEVAQEVFEKALDVDEEELDAAAGLALTLSAMRSYRSCVKQVDTVVSLDPEYVFEHRTDIDEDWLNLVAAKCWYMENRYDKCNEYLVEVNGYKEVDLDSPRMKELLIAEILRLESINM